MQTEWIIVNGVPTKLLQWESTPSNGKSIPIYIVCIPGNPGLVNVYDEFLEELHKRTNYPIRIIGHAGHNMSDTISMPSHGANVELYSLEGQIKHKASFIDKHIPKDAKIILIGHSIGCYIILNLLKIPSIRSRILKSYLLFPTIEYMAETRNGKIATRCLQNFMGIIVPLAFLFNLLPLFIQNFLVYLYLKISSIPNRYLGAVKEFIKPFTLKNVAFMALQEMHKVRQRDNKAIQNNLEKIKFYYGTTDGWCPVTYYDNIKKDIPDVDAEVCDKGFAHAFVLRDSKPMAVIVGDWIKSDI